MPVSVDTRSIASPNPYKLLAMITLILADLGLNCSLDYDLYNTDPKFIEGTSDLDWKGGILFALVGVQAIIQISIFLALFLTMADTFLFRVGLLNVLLKKFRSVLLLHPIYFTITIIAGSVRLQTIRSKGYTYRQNTNNYLRSKRICKINRCRFFRLWNDDNNFLALSVIQKLGGKMKFPNNIFNIISLIYING